ncbi:bacitracin synthase 3 [Laceyella sacchari]|uniref:non-ribosomal peptide synthetase n=1 Tax=Laceyella sacchari TaxID=37482 RepID=UPI00104C6104|nr:non-ribosomal peptide synthetase [Laceyella sacchari]TCW37425.1 bacitracin synthase 3 [Laceyella sacchari]
MSPYTQNKEVLSKDQAYDCDLIMQVQGEVDAELLKYLLDALYNEHSVDGRPLTFSEDDLRGLSAEQKASIIQAHRRGEGEKTDSASLQVIVVQDDGGISWLIFRYDRQAIDGKTLNLMIRKAFGAYNQQRLGQEPKHLSAFHEQRMEQSLEVAKAYWSGRFADYEHKPFFPAIPVDLEKDGLTSLSVTLHLDSERTDKLSKVAAQLDVPLPTILHGVWGVLLQKYGNADDVSYLSMKPERFPLARDVRQAIGLCVDATPVRVYGDNPSFAAIVADLHRDLAKGREHGGLHLAQLADWTGLAVESFDHFFVCDLDSEQLRGVQDDLTLIGAERSEQASFKLKVVATKAEDGLSIDFIYDSASYPQTFVQNMAGHVERIIEAVIRNPHVLVSEIDLCTEEEKHTMLSGFNPDPVSYPKHKTVQALFEEQVERHPERIALKYENQTVTYNELNRQANQLARVLRARGVKRGDKVGLMAKRSPEMVIGVLGIIKAGAVYVPLSPDYPEERIRYMAEDCQMSLLLKQPEAMPEFAYEGEICPLVRDIWIGEDDSNVEDVNTSDDLIYVIYTSGSTGKPKGVLIRHYNLTRTMINCGYIEIAEDDTILQLSNFAFDASVFDMFGALLHGAKLVLVPEEVLMDLKQLTRLIKEEAITVSFMTTALLNTLVDWDPHALAGLRKIIFGGEKASLKHVEKAYAVLGDGQLMNAYGPTETSVFTTMYPIKAWDAQKGIPIGKPINHSRVYVLNRHNQLQPIGVAGELCISGDGVGAGYLNRPDQTAQVFVDDPFTPGETMYRTGDLVRWLPDGNLEFLGRMDGQVKIRGHRIELTEIELKLLEHPAVQQTIVTAGKDEDGHSFLSGYIVLDKPCEMADIRRHLATTLPEYMVPTYLVELNALPLTANGKVDKRALPDPRLLDSEPTEELSAPTNETERKLAAIWEDILGIKRIGITDQFFESGGHSLKAMQLIARIRDQFGVEMSFQDAFDYPTIKEMASYIAGANQSRVTMIQRADEQDYYPVSAAQKRLYALQQWENVGTAYNTPILLEVEGRLDVKALTDALNAFVDRHEALRTSFTFVDGELVQQIHPRLEVEMKHVTVSDEAELESLVQGMIQPFDLSQAPLFRAGVFSLSDERHVLVLDMHHIISDGISHSILYRELGALYQKQSLPELPIQYKDYAVWEQSRDVANEEKERYWLEQFAGEVPVLELPTDYPRPSMQQFDGEVKTFYLPEEVEAQVKQLAKEQKSTLFITLLASYYVLLSKYSGQDDIIVGSPIAGRTQSELEPIFGMFVNTLPLRAHVPGEERFTSFLKRLQAQMLEAYERQDYPFDELVGKLGLQRDLSRNPLFDTMFVLQNMDLSMIQIPGLTFRPYPIQAKKVQFDLALVVTEEERLQFQVEYNTALFKRETVERMIGHVEQVLRQVTANPEIPVREISLITEQEKQQVLEVFNRTEAEYPHDKTLPELFEAQVARTPDEPALVFGEIQLTYRELDEQANRLARALRKKGVQPEQFVGILLERSPEMIIALLGVLKAGAAYLPIDPEYPQERIRYMLDDSQAKWLITQQGVDVPAEFAGETIRIEESEWREEEGTPLPVVNTPDHLAYMIYTSGSTGKPKGVMIEHRGVANLQLMAETYGIGPGSRVLQFSSISFDAAVGDIFHTLLNGGALYLIKKEQLLDGTGFVQWLKEQRITSMPFIPPSVLRTLPYLDLPDLTTISTGGEACSPDLVKVWGQGRTFLNAYGPTEGTVDATIGVCSPEAETITIGTPIRNKKAYVLSPEGQLQPIGVPGELCIGGEGLARGYWNRPDLTAEKFVPNPFRPGERMYKTGDLVRWLPTGEIEYLGRIDDQVKIRGHRIEIGEIETMLLEMEQVEEAVVLARNDKGSGAYLCAYIVWKTPGSVKTLRDDLSAILPHYMIPSYFVEMDKIPLTPNGKVDKKALPEPEGRVQTSAEYVAPQTPMETLLAQIWEEVLGVERVGIEDNFFELGGDSIKAIQISARLHQQQWQLEMKGLFRHPTIRELAPRITSKAETSAEQGVVTGNVPPTPIQQWFAELNSQASHHYNQAMMLHQPEGWDSERVKSTLTRLVAHHDALRMTAAFTDDGLVLINQGLEADGFTLSEYDFTGVADVRAAIEQEANRLQQSIDLEQGPLVKVGLFHTADGDYLLLVIHHLVVDGVSWRILLEDFTTLYEQADASLPLKTSSFQAWARKLREYAVSPQLLAEIPYWKRVETAQVPALPKDREPATEIYMKDRDSVRVHLSDTETAALLTQAHRAYHTEANDLLIAGLSMALKRWTGQDKVALYLEGHGREELFKEIDLTRTVGWFTSLYPVVLDMASDEMGRIVPTVKETLRQVPNKGVGYGILRYLTPAEMTSDLSFSCKPEISFNYLGQFDQGGLDPSSMPTGEWFSPETPVDVAIEINGWVTEGQLTLECSYDRTAFTEQTIHQLLNEVKRSLHALAEHCLAQPESLRTPSDFSIGSCSLEDLELVRNIVAEAEIQDLYHLSPMQEGILFHALKDKESEAYFDQITFRMEGVLDPERLKKSLDSLIQKYDVFRTVFIYDKVKKPIQVVLKHKEATFRYEDIRHLAPAEQSAHIEAFKRQDRLKGFDLTRDVMIRFALFQTGDRHYQMVFSSHHILMDGWCFGIIVEDWLNFYIDAQQTESAAPYSEYIRWLERQDDQQATAYWKEYLHGYEQAVSIPQDTLDGRRGSEPKAELDFRLDKELTERLTRTAARQRVTLNTMFQAIWGVLLQRYNDTDDVVFGAVISGRPTEIPDVEKMVGLFINTIPVRVQGQRDTSFTDLLAEMQENALASERYGYKSLAEIQAGTDLSGALFNHILVFENYPLDQNLFSKRADELGFTITGLDVFEQENFELSVTIYPGEQLHLKVQYDQALYSQDKIERLFTHLQTVMEQVVTTPEMKLAVIEIVSEAERTQLLTAFNRTDRPYPQDKTLHELFAEQVARTPDHPAVVFEDVSLTYRELHQRSNQLARSLRDMGVTRDQFVGMLTERTPDMIVGLLAVLKAGGAYVPIDPDYPQERIAFMLQDSQARLLLTYSHIQVPADFAGKVIRLDEPSWYEGDASELEQINQPTDLAYMIYTSGSTGKPKGVMIEHLGVCNLSAMADLYQITEGSRVLQFASISFDASVSEIFPALLTGATLYLVRKEQLVPDRFVQWLKEEKINFLGLSPSALQTFPYAELPDLRTILTGGEAVTSDLVKRWAQGRTFINAYGPTEVTVDATLGYCRAEDDKPTIGTPFPNKKVYILNRHNQLQPIGVPGELCVGGVGLARGYWGREDLTAEKFVPNPFNPEEKMYKTGDLARWLPNGEIEYLGRIDDQVKIRGHRVELGEVVERLLQLDGVREATVVPYLDHQGYAYLCAYTVLAEGMTVAQVREQLAAQLPNYMVPTQFVEMDALPLNANGKVDRKALPKPDSQSQTQREYVPPADELEHKLAEICQQLMGLERVGMNDNFFELGGHSLLAMSLVSQVHKVLNIEIPLNVIFTSTTLKELAQYLRDADKGTYEAIVPAGEREAYPVTSSQRRMFAIDSLGNAGTGYNLTATLMIEGELDPERLRAAWNQLVERHEPLRTSFHLSDGELVQQIHPSVTCDIELMEVEEAKGDAFIGEFVQPFELHQAPLARVALARLTETKHLFIVDMHHIITDGLSVGILFDELAQLLQGKSLPELKVQYKDYAVWQKSFAASETYQKQEAFWLDAFKGELPTLSLPTDFVRPPVKQFDGGLIRFELDEELTAGLKRVAMENGTTMYMTLLAAYNVLLSKYSGQDDIVVGSAIAGRNHPDVQSIFGLFVNTLVLRNHPQPQQSFTQFLQAVKERTLQCFDHADYPLEDLIDKLQLRRDMSRNPLFDTMFNYEGDDALSAEVPGLKLSHYDLQEKVAAQFDLTWTVYEDEDRLRFALSYATSLFKQETAERMVSHFIHLLQQVVNHPDSTLDDMALITEAETQQILHVFNNTRVEYPPAKPLPTLFEEQVARTPDRIAIEFGDGKWTYAEVNARANRLARMLRAKGVGPNQIVGLLAERSLEMMIGILGILKAGAAYMPISPEFPAERIDYMLDNSEARLILSLSKFRDLAGTFDAEVLYLDELALEQGEADNLPATATVRDLAYVIYTSGSTGKPKGVMIEHYTAYNRIEWMARQYAFGPEDVILQKTPIVFDVSVWELFLWFFVGARVHLLEPGGEKAPEIMINTIERYGITTMHFVPSMFHLFLEHLHEANLPRLSSLRRVFTSGEALLPNHAARFRDTMHRVNGTRLYNLYGPTEATVDVSYYDCPTDHDPAVIPIGKPIANVQLLVLDERNRLQPIGVPGELCLSGTCLARGYLNREDLTREKFVPNPYLPGELMYKTGDLARWMSDGNIEYLGRMDHQVKIRGYRIELDEVTGQLMKHPAVKDGAVIARHDAQGQAYLCAYLVSEADWDVAELRKHMGQGLPDYMIPAYFVELPELPLNANGKLDRKALPEPTEYVVSGAEYAAPTNEVEALLAEVWQQVLQIGRIGIHDNFFELGGDSIKAIQIAARLAQHQLRLNIKDIFQYETISALAPFIERNQLVIDQGPVTGEVPLTPIQRDFLTLHAEAPHHFNQAMLLTRRGGWDEVIVRAVFAKIVEHHDALRHVFTQTDGQWVQTGREPEADVFTLELFDLAGEPDVAARIEREADRLHASLNIEEGPLIRLGLFKAPEVDHLLIVIHHLIVDGVSWRILIEDLEAGYRQALANQPIKFPDKTHSYQAWSRMLREYANSKALLKEIPYWQELENQEVAPLPRESAQDTTQVYGDQDTVIVRLPESVTKQLLTDAHQAYRTEMNDLLLAALGLALKDWTGAERFAVHLEGHGREEIIEDIDLTRTVGWFTSIYPVVVDVSGGDLAESIKQVKEHLRKIPNKGVGYGILQHLTAPEHKQDLAFSLSPDILFNYLGQFDSDEEEGDVVISDLPTGQAVGAAMPNRYLLEVNELIVKGQLEIHLTYHTHLHRKETMEALGERYRQYLIDLVDHCLSQQEPNYTPSDFSSDDLTYDELDSIAELLDDL